MRWKTDQGSVFGVTCISILFYYFSFFPSLLLKCKMVLLSVTCGWDDHISRKGCYYFFGAKKETDVWTGKIIHPSTSLCEKEKLEVDLLLLDWVTREKWQNGKKEERRRRRKKEKKREKMWVEKENVKRVEKSSFSFSPPDQIHCPHH